MGLEALEIFQEAETWGQWISELRNIKKEPFKHSGAINMTPNRIWPSAPYCVCLLATLCGFVLVSVFGDSCDGTCFACDLVKL